MNLTKQIWKISFRFYHLQEIMEQLILQFSPIDERFVQTV